MGIIKEELSIVDRFTAPFQRFISLGNKAAQSATYTQKSTESMANVASQRINILNQSLTAQANNTARLQREYRTLSTQRNASARALSSLERQISNSQKKEYSYAMAIAKTTSELKKATVQEKLNEAAILKKEAAIKKAKLGSGNAMAAEGLWGTLKRAAVFTGGIALVKNIVSASDQQSSLNARIDMMNDGLQTTEQLRKRIYNSAQNSRGSYANTADMVGKFGTLAPGAFGSSAEIVDFAEQINKHLTLSGATGAGGEAAVLQLTQALGSGVLRGEELNSVLEQTPTIAQAIAQYMGVNVAEMRKLAADGAITAGVVKNALFAAADETNAKFKEMPMTFSQLWQSGMNAVQQAATPFLQMLASGATMIHDKWDIIAPVLIGVAAAAGVVAIALAAQAAATWIANAANRAFIAGLLSNPLTWIAVAIGVVVAAIYKWIQSVGGISIAWMIAKNYVLTAWDAIQIGFMVGVYAVMNWLDNMNLAFTKVGINIANSVGDMKVNVLTLIEDMVNGAIGLLNDFITSVNKIPGVAIDLVDEVSFAANAAANNEAAKAARTAELAALESSNAQNQADRARQLESMKRQAAAKEMERLAGIAGARAESEKAAQESLNPTSAMPYDGIKNVDKVGKVGKIDSDIKLSDEDLKIYRDLAERRYMNNVELQTLAPQISVSIPESAAKNLTSQDIADKLKMILIEQAAAGTAVSHG